MKHQSHIRVLSLTARRRERYSYEYKRGTDVREIYKYLSIYSVAPSSTYGYLVTCRAARRSRAGRAINRAPGQPVSRAATRVSQFPAPHHTVDGLRNHDLKPSSSGRAACMYSAERLMLSRQLPSPPRLPRYILTLPLPLSGCPRPSSPGPVDDQWVTDDSKNGWCLLASVGKREDGGWGKACAASSAAAWRGASRFSGTVEVHDPHPAIRRRRQHD